MYLYFFIQFIQATMENHTSVIKEKADVEVEGDEPGLSNGGVSDEIQEMDGEVSVS